MSRKPINPASNMMTALGKPPPSMSSKSSLLPPKQPGQFTEYKLRVPKNLVKRYNVMKVRSPRPIKFGEIKEANMIRKTKKQVFAEDGATMVPTHGAGSVYNYERKEEARKKRRGYIQRKINTDDLPYALRLGGKGGKRYTGKKEQNLENASYFILTQCPDGVFEAVPVQAWYNFMPDVDYATLSAEEVEHEFSKRSRAMLDFQEKYNFGNPYMPNDQELGKVKHNDDNYGLKIHDDDMDMGDNADDDADFGSGDEKKAGPSSSKKAPGKKEKDIYRGKKGKADNDSDEEETIENLESKEVDYMSESSSEDEALEMDDEPDPEKENAGKAKDDLNLFMDSEEDEDEKELDEAGKELKAMLKKEAGSDNSSVEDDDDEVDEDDIDNEFSSSAVFMQGKDKKKKGKSGSTSSSKTGSRSNTPIQTSDQALETISQAANSLRESKSLKRNHENSTPSPDSKKQKHSDSPKTISEVARTNSPLVRPGTPSDGNGITEEAVRRYLSHKPMTTTDLLKKFKNKNKQKNMSKEQTVGAIAAILKKIQPVQEKIEGKLYLSIKQKK